MILETDACDYGYGAALVQAYDEGKRPVAFFSGNYTRTQRNYHTSEKELLAVVKAIEHFHQYLYGAFFRVYTDHLPLTWLMNKKNPNPQLARWLQKVDIYQFEICYKPGKENVIADLLSRLPDENEVEKDSEDFKDIIVAVVEEDYERGQDEDEEVKPYDQAFNLNVLSIEPSSNIVEQYESIKQEQERDPDIRWIKELIQTHKDSKPETAEGGNSIQKQLLREYDNLRLIDDVVYRDAEDANGFVANQLLLPAGASKAIVSNLHSSVFNAHLGRKKTTELVFGDRT
jgi:hypothetical protein